jgi:hypothetical protein
MMKKSCWSMPKACSICLIPALMTKTKSNNRLSR